MKYRSFIQKIEIKTKWFFRGLSLSRANNAKLSQGSKAKTLRKFQKTIMLEGVVDAKMVDYH